MSIEALNNGAIWDAGPCGEVKTMGTRASPVQNFVANLTLSFAFVEESIVSINFITKFTTTFEITLS